MVLKRSRGYEDIENSSTSPPVANNRQPELDNVVPQEIEMASVSVVPDGKILSHKVYFSHLWIPKTCRYIHGDAGCKCVRFWVVSS